MSKLRGILQDSLLDTDFISCIFTTHCKIQGTDKFSSGLSYMGLLYPPGGLGTFVCAFFLILLLIANAGDLKESLEATSFQRPVLTTKRQVIENETGVY